MFNNPVGSLAVSIAVALLFLSLTAPAQTTRQWQRAAQKALDNHDPQTALYYLSQAWHKDTSSALSALMWAQAYFAAHQYEQTVTWSNKCIGKNPSPQRLKQAQQLLAESFYRLGQYNEAASIFLALKQPDNIERCNKARQIPTSQDKVFNLGTHINTGYSEFAPLIHGDSLLFASLRFNNPADKHTPQRAVARMMVTTGGKKATPLPKLYNDPSAHTAHFTYSTDGRLLLFTRCRWQEGLRIRCAIWQMQKNAGGRWSKPVEVAELRSTGTNTQPHIYYDSLDRTEKLIFVSDRPGGAGGTDLWLSVRQNNKWTPPAPVTQLNTPGNEYTPHFNAARQTLYFSTDGRFGLGGSDVYSAQRTSTGFDSIVHLPPPINSGYEDLYFVTEPCGCSGVFASNRPGSAYLDAQNKTCCYDLYGVIFNKPTPTDNDSIPTVPPATISIVAMPSAAPPTIPEPPTAVEDFVGLFLYFDNDRPDPRSNKNTTTLSYTDTFEPYYSQLNDYVDNYSGNDPGLADSVRIFFENEVAGNYYKWQQFQELLLLQLRAGKSIRISLRGYTSPRAQSRYNDLLAARRIAAVQNDLLRASNGILSQYIQSGQLTILPVAFGESKASAAVSDRLDDRKNSIYSPAAARERRVEIVKIDVRQ